MSILCIFFQRWMDKGWRNYLLSQFLNYSLHHSIRVPEGILSSSPAHLAVLQSSFALFRPRSHHSTLDTRMLWSPIKLICDTLWILHRKLPVPYSEIHPYYTTCSVFTSWKIENPKLTPDHYLLFYVP